MNEHCIMEETSFNQRRHVLLKKDAIVTIRKKYFNYLQRTMC